jgi:very-short-patch-repair endonuclease
MTLEREPSSDSRAERTRTESIGRRIDRVARARGGLVSTADLDALGLSRHQRSTLVRHGTLDPVHLGVFRTVGTTPTTRNRLVAACLAAGGEVGASHRAGLWVWKLCDDEPPIEITVAVQRHPIRRSLGRQVIVHRSLDLAPNHLTVRDGVPVTKPARTLVDVGCVVRLGVLEEAVERALLRRLVSVAGLRAMIDEVAGSGRNGVGVLRKLLDQRALGDSKPESMLEPLMARLCARNNVAGVEYQATLMVHGHRFRPDFLIRDAKLVIETDGFEVHGTKDALDYDLARQNLLVADGWQVLRYTRTHLRAPARTAAQILQVADQRRAELGATPMTPPS